MAPRRIGALTSKTRSSLLNAAESLMRESGYAAVTSRRLAAKAGLKPQLVHYYFRTMDDLFLASVPSSGGRFRGTTGGNPRRPRSRCEPFGISPAIRRAWCLRMSLSRWRTTARPSGRRSPRSATGFGRGQAKILAHCLGDAAIGVGATLVAGILCCSAGQPRAQPRARKRSRRVGRPRGALEWQSAASSGRWIVPCAKKSKRRRAVRQSGRRAK